MRLRVAVMLAVGVADVSSGWAAAHSLKHARVTRHIAISHAPAVTRSQRDRITPPLTSPTVSESELTSHTPTGNDVIHGVWRRKIVCTSILRYAYDIRYTSACNTGVDGEGRVHVVHLPPGQNTKQKCSVCGLNMLLLQALCIRKALEIITSRRQNSIICCGGA